MFASQRKLSEQSVAIWVAYSPANSTRSNPATLAALVFGPFPCVGVVRRIAWSMGLGIATQRVLRDVGDVPSFDGTLCFSFNE